MFSSLMTVQKLACLYLMENSMAFTLMHDIKNTWLDCKRHLLLVEEFRNMKNAFKKIKVESDPPPPLFIGHQV